MSQYQILTGATEATVYNGEDMVAVFYGSDVEKAQERAARFVAREEYLDQLADSLYDYRAPDTDTIY